jgi:hypothetical protein
VLEFVELELEELLLTEELFVLFEALLDEDAFVVFFFEEEDEAYLEELEDEVFFLAPDSTINSMMSARVIQMIMCLFFIFFLITIN